MNPPQGIALIKGEIADYYYSPEGILYSYSNTNSGQGPMN